MGIDAVAFIEVRDGSRWATFAGPLPWMRNRSLILFLHGYGYDGNIFLPLRSRGIPDDISETVHKHYWIPIYEGEKSCFIKDGVSEALANEWVERSGSRIKLSEDTNPIKKWVSELSCKTPTWMTAQEFRIVLEEHSEAHPEENTHIFIDATLAAMEVLGEECRLVCWFC